MLLIEAVSSDEFVGGAKKHRFDPAIASGDQQMIQEFGRDAEGSPAIRCRNEHFSQRPLRAADILQADRGDNSPLGLGDPEITCADLVEVRDSRKIRLIRGCNLNTELFSLNRQDDVEDR
jgi:hypothetical protein